MACLPVSTIALSGVITRMPRVCMSIVDSAFQYGWAPTLMPATTMSTSPAGLGVLDEPAQHAGDPVEVLAAGVHGDLGPGRQGEPLDRHVHRRRQVDRRQQRGGTRPR